MLTSSAGRPYTHEMILFEICGRNEAHPLYQRVEAENAGRQYDFLRTLIEASLETGRPFLSGHVIKALNFHAITCLHTNAGEYRPCQVYVGDYVPPEHYLVQSYMDDCVNTVNRSWELADPLALGAFVLWRLNYIHPFINGNGRSARAACYFVICLKLGNLLPGKFILPELLRAHRDEYVAVLKLVDASHHSGKLDLLPLQQLLQKLLIIQVNSAGDEGAAGPAMHAAAAEAPPVDPSPLLLPPPSAEVSDER